MKSASIERVVLDLIVKDAIISNNIQEISTPLWIVINVDGLERPFSTNVATGGSHPVWNFPVRVVIQVPDVSKAYLYATLCTYGPNHQGSVPVARSRIGLRALPRGSPKQFSFPLMRTQNGAQELASLTLAATLGVTRQVKSDAGRQPPKLELVPSAKLSS